MKRKVKPLKWFEGNCEKDEDGDYIHEEGESFTVAMSKYCGKEIDCRKTDWHFYDYMLEPFNWFDFITEHFGKFVLGAVILALVATVIISLIERK